MYSIILRITHNVVAKDSIAVLRGAYRVLEGALGQSSNIRRSSWMDSPQQPLQTNTFPQKINATPEHSNEANSSQDISNINQPKVTNDTLHQNKSTFKDTTKLNVKEQKVEKPYLRNFQEKKHEEVFHPSESSVPQSRFSRFFEFGKLGVSLATTSLFAGKDKDENYYQGIAQKVSNQLCKMRGAPLKLAQMLSIQEDSLIPLPIRKAFEKARQTAHVIPKHEVEFMMKKSLGENWRDYFKEFQDKPFASASIGQVHKGILQNDKEVAIKVQYHAVKQSINSDINNLHLLLKLPKVFPKTMFMDRILKKTREELMMECDYIRQAKCQQLYEQCMKNCLGEQSQFFKVPDINELSTNEILISQFITGIKMKDIEQIESYSQSLKDQLGRRIMLLTFKELFEMGIMQSDPNPSNFTYNHAKDQLNLYDFGATHIYRPEFLNQYYRIISGAVEEDQDKVWDASIKTGFVTGEENQVMKKSHIESIRITGEPLRYDGEYDFGKQQITKRIYKTIPLMLKNRLKPPPEQVYSLHRKLSGSYLACIRLKARVNCSAIFKQIKFRTLASEQPYNQILINDKQ